MRIGPYNLNQVHQGYVPEVLAEVPDESVHCVITSPVYCDRICRARISEVAEKVRKNS